MYHSEILSDVLTLLVYLMLNTKSEIELSLAVCLDMINP